MAYFRAPTASFKGWRGPEHLGEDPLRPQQHTVLAIRNEIERDLLASGIRPVTRVEQDVSIKCDRRDRSRCSGDEKPQTLESRSAPAGRGFVIKEKSRGHESTDRGYPARNVYRIWSNTSVSKDSTRSKTGSFVTNPVALACAAVAA